MGGLSRLFIRILPIITLICFVCFGISYTFETQQTGNITYLSKEIITLNDNQTPNDTTDDLTIEQYKFDMVNYTQNINGNLLKSAVENVFNINAYTNTTNNFNLIWENGYQPLDVTKTILNAVVLVLNTIILPINIFLVPLRITTAIILTGLSIVGININNNTPIITSLRTITSKTAIPFIDPLHAKFSPEEVADTTWYFNETIDWSWIESWQTLYISFESDNYTYQGIQFDKRNETIVYHYKDNNDQWQSIIVYQNGQWIYQVSRTIYIQNQQSSSLGELYNYLYPNATRIY